MKHPSVSPSQSLLDVSLLIDWISTTCRETNEEFRYPSHPALHDRDMWNDCKPRLGYEIGSKHHTGVVALASLKRHDMGIHTIYSGKSLRRIKEMYELDGFDVLKFHINAGHTLARLDIALDFRGCGLDVQDFVDCWYADMCETRLRTANITKSLNDDGYTFYLGSKKKRTKLVRIYNKASEQGVEGDWLRVEIQLMGKPATRAGIALAHTDEIEKTMLSIIRGVVDFKGILTWVRVFDGSENIKLGTSASEGSKTMTWLNKQVIPTIAREVLLDSAFWVQFNMFVAVKTAELRGD